MRVIINAAVLMLAIPPAIHMKSWGRDARIQAEAFPTIATNFSEAVKFCCICTSALPLHYARPLANGISIPIAARDEDRKQKCLIIRVLGIRWLISLF